MKAGKIWMSVFAVTSALWLGAVSASDKPRIVSFDHGSLDTLAVLGLSEHVVAVPRARLPAYLENSSTAQLADAGTLRGPDYPLLQSLAPDVVLITDRQADLMEALAQVATVKDMTVAGESYWASLVEKVTSLGRLFGEEARALAALGDLREQVDAARSRIDGQVEVVVVTHNQGRFSVREVPVISDLLGVPLAPVPADIEPVVVGERRFTPVTPQTLARMMPSHVLIVDRSAALGQEGVDLAALRASLDVAGAKDIKLVNLSADLWYLSGGGLQSVALQVDEVISLL